MAVPARRASFRHVWLVSLFVASYALDAVLLTDWGRWLSSVCPWPLNSAVHQLVQGFHVTLYASSALAALALVVRAVGARARRFGLASLAERYPTFVHRVLPWLPAVLWIGSYAAKMFPYVHWDRPWWYLANLLGTAITGAGMSLLARTAIRRSTATPADAEPAEEGLARARPCSPRSRSPASRAARWARSRPRPRRWPRSSRSARSHASPTIPRCSR